MTAAHGTARYTHRMSKNQESTSASISTHILGASANLLGFTFFVLSGVKALGVAASGLITEMTALSILFFTSSCLMSFLAIRTRSSVRSRRYELVADFVFFAGLFIVTGISILLAFNLVHINV